MSVSPRRKADHISSSPLFSPIDTEAFLSAKPAISLSIANRRNHFEGNDRPSPSNMKVSDRMRLFEAVDESVRERPASALMRKSPFKGALDAFIVGAPGDIDVEKHPTKVPSFEKEEQVSRPVPTSTLKTKIGNREVKPLVTAPQPIPLVGLPIPKIGERDLSQEPRDANQKRMSRLSVRLSKLAPTDVVNCEESSSLKSFSESGQDDLDSNETQSSKDLFDDLEVDNLEQPDQDYASSLHGDEERLIDLSDSFSGHSSSQMTLQDPDLMPRFSYRQSYRMEKVQSPIPDDKVRSPPKSSFRNSRRLGNEGQSDLNFLQEPSSFLDFDDDSRLTPLDSSAAMGNGKGAGMGGAPVMGIMSFDEADSFDTFATLSKGLKIAQDLKGSILPADVGDDERPGSNESEKPLFPMMSFSKKNRKQQRQDVDDDDDGGLDVPNRFTRRPGAANALRDLQRASVTAGNEISANLRFASNAQEKVKRANTKERVSKAQGDILLRSRIFRRFNLRYASLVHQGYFGAVLLLFTPDSKAGISPSGTFALKSSKMIALAESSVRRVDNARKTNQGYMFELKTCQRTYTFACNDEKSREFWINNLSSV